jgi:hypothetical protein
MSLRLMVVVDPSGCGVETQPRGVDLPHSVGEDRDILCAPKHSFGLTWDRGSGYVKASFPVSPLDVKRS